MRRRNVLPSWSALGKRDVGNQSRTPSHDVCISSCGTTTEKGARFGQPCLGANVLTAVRNPARYPEISR